jgi:hypothetical protein
MNALLIAARWRRGLGGSPRPFWASLGPFGAETGLETAEAFITAARAVWARLTVRVADWSVVWRNRVVWHVKRRLASVDGFGSPVGQGSLWTRTAGGWAAVGLVELTARAANS